MIRKIFGWIFISLSALAVLGVIGNDDYNIELLKAGQQPTSMFSMGEEIFAISICLAVLLLGVALVRWSKRMPRVWK